MKKITAFCLAALICFGLFPGMERAAGVQAAKDIDFFEPVYDDAYWDVTDSAKSDAASKAVTLPKGSTATYKTPVPFSGDFVLSAGLTQKGTNTGNRTWLYFNYEDTKNYMAVILYGSKQIGFIHVAGGKLGAATVGVSGTNGVIQADTAKGVSTTNNCKLLIHYDALTGGVKIYEIAAAAQKLVLETQDAAMTGKSGTIRGATNYADGGLSNIMFNKPFAGRYFEDFEDETTAEDWNLNGEYQFAPYGTTSDGNALYKPTEFNTTSLAELKAVYTTGSYRISADYYSPNNNKKFIYFNRLSGSVWYALCFSGQGADTTAQLLKGSASASLTGEPVKVGSVTHFEIAYNADTGEIAVYLNHGENPALTAVDVDTETETAYNQGWFAYQTYWANPSYIDNLTIETTSAVFEAGRPSLSGSLTAGSTITGEVEITNTTDADRTVTLVLGVYTNDGRLTGAQVSEQTALKKSGRQSYQISKTLDAAELAAQGKNSAKCFVFNGTLAELAPLTNPAAIYDSSAVWLIGDSICCEYAESSARKGWGMYLRENLDENFFPVKNMALSGRTVKKYFEEDAAYPDYTWAKIKEKVREGDVILLSLGINDYTEISQNADASWEANYLPYLKKISDDAKALKAELIFITPTVALWGEENTVTVLSQNIYVAAAKQMKKSAEENGVLCLDLNAAMLADLNAEMAANTMTAADIQAKYYEGDKLHLSETGARYVKDLIVKLLKESAAGLAPYLQ